jgi:hypothetical protein
MGMFLMGFLVGWSPLWWIIDLVYDDILGIIIGT